VEFEDRFNVGFYQDSSGTIVEITDTIGAVDSRSLGIVDDIVDALGITHAVPTQAASYAQTRTDPLGGLDPASQVGSITDARSDSAGLADLPNQVAAYARTTTGRVMVPF